MKRRNFIKGAAAVTAVSTVLPNKLLAGNLFDERKIIKPPRLKVGDTIGLVSPASFIKEDELTESIKNLESLGFKTVYNKEVLSRSGYLGGTDKERADDLNNMFANKEVKGIVCTRGGWGAARMLPLLNYELIKNNPKILLGYSDITSLCYGITAKTGLVTFHGPVGTSTYNDFSINNFKNVLMNPSGTYRMFNAPGNPEKKETIAYTIRSGKATGELTGGNLSIVCSLIGTQYDIDTSGKIVFLEEVEEEPYRIDRMLTQMIQANKFENAKGIALGIFSKCEPKEKDPGFPVSFSLQEVLIDRLYNLNIPVIYGMSFGHIINKFTLPLGIKAELDVDNQVLNLLEPAVL